jgi:hypothetical protein
MSIVTQQPIEVSCVFCDDNACSFALRAKVFALEESSEFMFVRNLLP